MRPRGRRVSLGSLGCTLGVVEFTAVVGFIEVRHPTSLRPLGNALGVVWFVSGHRGAPWGSSGSSGVSGLIGVHPWGRPG